MAKRFPSFNSVLALIGELSFVLGGLFFLYQFANTYGGVKKFWDLFRVSNNAMSVGQLKSMLAKESEEATSGTSLSRAFDRVMLNGAPNLAKKNQRTPSSLGRAPSILSQHGQEFQQEAQLILAYPDSWFKKFADELDAKETVLQLASALSRDPQGRFHREAGELARAILFRPFTRLRISDPVAFRRNHTAAEWAFQILKDNIQDRQEFQATLSGAVARQTDPAAKRLLRRVFEAEMTASSRQ